MSLLSDLGTKIGTELKSLWSAVNNKVNRTDTVVHFDKGLFSDITTGNYDDVTIKDTDAHLGIYSSNDATWGSAINFYDFDSASKTINDTWSIARHTNGAGGALNFNFGTSAQHDNPNIMQLTTSGILNVGGNQVLTTASNGIIKTQSTEPTSPTDGTFWFDTTTNKLKVYLGNSWLIINSSNSYDIFGDNSMVAYYKLINNSNDETGMFNGTNQGSVTYGYDTTKNFYYAETTYAGQGWISLPTEILDNRSSFTMAGWIKPTGKIQDSGIGGWSNLSPSAETHLNMNVDDALTSATAGFTEITTDAQGNINTGMSAQTVSPNNWVHLIGTYDGTTIKFYINGILKTTSTSATGTIRMEAGLGIGRTSADAGEFSSAKFAEVMFLSRAINDSEALNLFNRY